MSTKLLRRGLPFSPEVAGLVARMETVEEHRENLQRLQAMWDTLALLGQMSGTVPDIGNTRRAFETLGNTLLDALATRTLAHLRHGLQARAQVAIDILVRNLFERTADVGFLATDSVLRHHVQQCAARSFDTGRRQALEGRFREYVAKYSVYDDIVVLSPQGDVLARLDHRLASTGPGEAPWLAEALRGSGYVEHAGLLPLLGGRPGLLYAHAIRGEAGAVIGVLCLSFRFDDEMRRIFGQLCAPAEAGAIVLLDGQGTVVASSDPWLLPVGAPLPGHRQHRLRFAGRDFIAAWAAPSGYEGYGGPGWSALALVPSDLAFEAPATDTDAPAATSTAALQRLAGHIDTQGLFDAQLQAIGPQAQQIERGLARLLWNGRLRQSGEAGMAGAAFAGTLLGEVGLTGERLRRVFDEAIGNLHRATLAAVFDRVRHHARLAIDIMDRNLYERANDVRWWALDDTLRAALAGQADAAQAESVLGHINRLYTVYALIVLFDPQGQVVAVSQPAAADWRGRVLAEPWVAEALACRDSQGHAVSRHAATALYGGRATYVFATALRDAQQQVVGGIGIVFDGAPQFAAMLADALPRDLPGQALIVTRGGLVVASTDASVAPGSPAVLPPGWAALAAGQSGACVIDIDGVAHAVGYAMAGGYREYPVARRRAEDDVGTLVLTPLGRRLAEPAQPVAAFEPSPLAPGARPAVRVAAFRLADAWFGLPIGQVVQALEGVRITALPNARPQLPGLVSHDDALLPVLDLAVLRGIERPRPEDAPLVVAQYTLAGGAPQRLALRVDALGPVFDAGADQLQPSPGPGEQLVQGQGRHMLTLLDARVLWGATSDRHAAVDHDALAGHVAAGR